MNQSRRIACPNEHQAFQVCAMKGCQFPPLICSMPQCQCFTNHSKCPTVHVISSLRLRMEEKGCYLLPVYQQLCQWYQNQIKFFNIKLQDTRKIILDKVPVLFGDEEKLYKMICEGRSADITTTLVSSVINSLLVQPQFQIKDKLIKLKKQLRDFNKQLQESVKKIKQLQNPKKYIPERKTQTPKFKDYLHHPDIQIRNDGNILKLLKSDKNYKTALIESPIQSFKATEQIYKFKVKKTEKKLIMIGFCLQKHALQNNYINNYAADCGGYVVSCKQGQIYTHDQQKVVYGDKRNNVVDVGDVLHVVYIASQNKVEFRNVGKGTKDSIIMMGEPGSLIYACVQLFDLGDQVEFMGLELTL